MKVLLLYQYLNHTRLVKSLADVMEAYDIDIECLDFPTLHFISRREGRSAYKTKLFHFFSHFGKMGRVVNRPLSQRYIIDQLDDYNVIDIHSYDLFYNNIIPIIKSRGLFLIIMVWGSDFYRASRRELEEKRKGFFMADIIHLESENVKDDFLKVYPEFEDKIRIVQFGLNQLETIKMLMEEPEKRCTLIKRNILQDKIIVTCGYNGIKSQQHKLMINALGELPSKVKEKLYVMMPFTYGGSEQYKKEIDKCLKKTKLPYTLLDRKLSEEEVAELRIISNVVINIQTSDSFSASLQEHMMAGSVLIVGDWLPYDVFAKQGLYYLKTDIDNLSNVVEKVLLNYSHYSEQTHMNRQLIYDFSSWNSVSREWASMYMECNKIRKS